MANHRQVSREEYKGLEITYQKIGRKWRPRLDGVLVNAIDLPTKEKARFVAEVIADIHNEFNL